MTVPSAPCSSARYFLVIRTVLPTLKLFVFIFAVLVQVVLSRLTADRATLSSYSTMLASWMILCRASSA